MATFDHNPSLNTLDLSVGRLLRARSKDDSEIVELAGSLTSHALRQGHVCLDLDELQNSIPLEYSKSDSLKDISPKLRSHTSVGSESHTTRPLILSKANKLYFHRYWHYEQKLIKAIQDRIQCTPDKDSKEIAITDSLGNDQKRAVRLATQSLLTLISGGPGTGKTTTVLYVLASLQERNKDEPLKIALAAPTGKAAQRIQESLESGLEKLPLSEASKDQITTSASTIHRLLGYKRNSSQFQHNENNPLPFDVVIVDEASMLDLLLFTKLLGALKTETRLILLGDSHQLSSVEAGSIFGDLMVASHSNQNLGKHTVELKENFRFGNDSKLYQACEYIKHGKSEQTLALLEEGSENLTSKTLPSNNRLISELEQSFADHFVSLTQLTDPQIALNALSNTCLLTPLRKGPYGVEGLNQAMETLVRNRLQTLDKQRHFNGQPILVTANSYTQGLFNGDLGIIMQAEDEPDSLFAYFPDENEETKRHPLSALPAFESAYAFTVHKSQGSEYKNVVLILPSIESPILSQELIYTAISRSRNRAEIWGETESLKMAINNPTRRTSGILDYLTAH
ncbi:exodeoxyribonuclease V subunit alpha [Opitutia bacterium ISCC 51]|nr:exodeoxyribonuclease V subunit alpha [Opitutae bacterium ISCC 51]QXD26567.1 exodeoxyribonuclease V subunit alpha [Opitutae bacterium ISCC 52]